MNLHSRLRGCLLGLAAGDAVGTTVEFQPRGSFPPMTDMIGGGPFGLPAGAWTDDTSMALCLGASFAELGEFDAKDQMERYARWRKHGYMSSTGRCFDIGLTVAGSLERFAKSGDPFSGLTDPGSAGNGCIMRLAPVPIFYHADLNLAIHWAGESSRTTHGSLECVESCKLMTEMIHRAFAGMTKAEVLQVPHPERFQAPRVRAIAEGSYHDKSIEEIQGSGYVIECLEASAWCFARTNSFRDAVLEAVNLGRDADTTGAVCGQIAGAFYGEQGIPADWLKKLVLVEEIRALVDRLAVGPRI